MDDADVETARNLPLGRFENILRKFESGKTENESNSQDENKQTNETGTARILKSIEATPPLKPKPKPSSPKPALTEKIESKQLESQGPTISFIEKAKDGISNENETLDDDSKKSKNVLEKKKVVTSVSASLRPAAKPHSKPARPDVNVRQFDSSTPYLYEEPNHKQLKHCAPEMPETESSTEPENPSVAQRLKVFQTSGGSCVSPQKRSLKCRSYIDTDSLGKSSVAEEPLETTKYSQSALRKKTFEVGHPPEKPPPPCFKTHRKVASLDLSLKENPDVDNRRVLPLPCSSAAQMVPPPKKPPRTYRHDEYARVKEDQIIIKENTFYESASPKKKITEKDEGKHKSKYGRPPRPPPPRPRPAFMTSADIHQQGNTENSSCFSTEVLPITPCQTFDVNKNDARSPNYFQLRKCHSIESIAIESSYDDKIYSHPSTYRSRDDLDAIDQYEVYIDSDGYAVPYKFVLKDARKKGSLEESNIVTRASGLREKIQEFRRLITEPVSKSGKPGHDLTKVNRGKLNMVRQRINQAFSVLQRYVKKLDSAQADEVVTTESDLGDSDSIVDTAEIQKRVEYCSSIKIMSSQRIKKSIRILDKIYPQLFEYVLRVGIRPSKSGTNYEPYIIYKFPEIRNYKVDTAGHLLLCSSLIDSNVSIPQFCFPDAEDLRPHGGTSSDTYWFVLTGFDGAQVYGYCRRLWPPFEPYLPEVICIISPIEAINMYNSLLDELENRRLISEDIIHELMAASFGRPLPNPGKSVQIQAMNNDAEIVVLSLHRPTDKRLSGINLECLLANIGVEKLILVFSTMLMERSLILCAKKLSILSATVHALVALLYPFCWQHTYIPVLPPEMLEVVCSPTPFIVCVLANSLPEIQAMPLEEVVILDLDKKSLVRTVGDESTILPKKLQKALKTALNMCKIDIDVSCSNLMISEAFLRLFVETVGHIRLHVRTQQNGENVFQKEQFIKSVNSKSIRHFLEWFTETQMFNIFKHDQLEKGSGAAELFLTRVYEYSLDESSFGIKSNVKELGKKMWNFGKALKTKFTDG